MYKGHVDKPEGVSSRVGGGDGWGQGGYGGVKMEISILEQQQQQKFWNWQNFINQCDTNNFYQKFKKKENSLQFALFYGHN